jgi:hypothetical protein
VLDRAPRRRHPPARHSVALFSKQFPKGDLGGNSFAVKRGDTPTNLHTYWDNAFGNGTSLDTIKKQIDGFKANPELTRAKLLGPKPSARTPMARVDTCRGRDWGRW